MNKLTKKEVEHIAKLARISLTDVEITAYQETLATLMNEIAQVEAVDSDDLLVSPSVNQNIFYESGEMFELNTELLNNAPHKKGAYIEVERVLND